MTYLAVDGARNGCTQTHAGYVADVPVMVYEYRAHTRHDEHKDDQKVALPLEHLTGADERQQQTERKYSCGTIRYFDITLDAQHRIIDNLGCL